MCLFSCLTIFRCQRKYSVATRLISTKASYVLSGITGEYQGTMKKKGWSTGRPSSAVETENGEQKKKKKKRQKKGGKMVGAEI